METVEIGASIACSGACLTVVEKGRDGDGYWFAVDASAETLSKTTLGNWASGHPINLERALKVGDELGGHIVSGPCGRCRHGGRDPGRRGTACVGCSPFRML